MIKTQQNYIMMIILFVILFITTISLIVYYNAKKEKFHTISTSTPQIVRHNPRKMYSNLNNYPGLNTFITFFFEFEDPSTYTQTYQDLIYVGYTENTEYIIRNNSHAPLTSYSGNNRTYDLTKVISSAIGIENLGLFPQVSLQLNILTLNLFNDQGGSSISYTLKTGLTGSMQLLTVAYIPTLLNDERETLIVEIEFYNI